MIVYPNAKINLGLNITSCRPDGYHDIETIFYPIAVCDMLEMVFPESGDAEYAWSSSGDALDVDAEHNICIRALRLLRQRFDIPMVAFHLHKNIPSGAGLGGGSADAAFVIRHLNDLLHLGMTDNEMMATAAKLGADCPFFIKNKPMYATGIGDILSPINISLKGKYIAIAKPDVHVSTADAYRGVVPQKPDEDLRDIVSMPIEEWHKHLKNDFEPTIFAQHPEIRAIKEFMYDKGALYASMSGSGSAVYGIFDKPTDCKYENCKNYFCTL
ncbi:MAG: 4-(cytidine 5'-diphospho)-2-C-methyl-D-erythritol kinase [Bacteroidales bacterium]|nr:4-(cytidine 5'-diphospho)-2-C-methyl-D-erythritol kinase [Bacteroidales bacterium]